MARPSIKKQRTEEILQAYERCIALYGVDGATLQRISEEAGLARPLLRHHVGNSDDLLEQALDRFLKRGKDSMEEFYNALPNPCDGETFLAFLFDEECSEDQQSDVMIASSFIAAAQTRPDVRAKMKGWFTDFEKEFTARLSAIYPEASQDVLKDVAYGIIGIYFNVESLQPLSQGDVRHHSYNAALQLLKILD